MTQTLTQKQADDAVGGPKGATIEAIAAVADAVVCGGLELALGAVVAPAVTTFPPIRARSYRGGGNLPVTRVVIHTTQGPCSPEAARNVAEWFRHDDCKVSSHYVVDPSEVVQCVLEEDTAWHAPPNAGSVGIELCGVSDETDWESTCGKLELSLAVDLVADICQRHSLPAVWLTVEQVRAGERGITGHAEVGQAFTKSSHTDPGRHFPRQNFIKAVREKMGGPCWRQNPPVCTV